MTGVVASLPSRLAAGRRPRPPRARRRLTVGLVNNMPDAALNATERQFERLIGRETGEHDVELRLFYLPGTPRGEAARAQLRSRYEPVDTLLRSDLDGLVVTGAEPKSEKLRDEPYWDDVAELADWAKTHTTSTIWSCLAAHAAVLHLDGIERRRLPVKAFGIHACLRIGQHPLLAGLPGTIEVPHSRHNGLGEGDLAHGGYDILTRSDEVGVDCFVKSYPSLFVFLQGHPEYGRDSLAREFKRDVERFLAGKQPAPPSLPRDYFDATAEVKLAAFLAHAMAPRGDRDGLHRLPDLGSLPLRPPAWQPSATLLYRNWIGMLADAQDPEAAIENIPASANCGAGVVEAEAVTNLKEGDWRANADQD